MEISEVTQGLFKGILRKTDLLIVGVLQGRANGGISRQMLGETQLNL